MAEWPETNRRILAGEDDRTEFKRGFGDLRPVGKAIAAFANTEGGLLIVGVDDNGGIVGVKEDPDKVAERITSFLQTGLSSPVQARLGRNHEAEGWVHWIDVPRQRGFEPLRFEGRVFVRRGRASVEPSPAELQDLYNLFGYIITEERVVGAAGVDSIDAEVFKNYLNRLGLDLSGDPQPGLETDLAARGVISPIGNDYRATLYGILAFGKDPQAFPQTSNFRIECVAYDGTDRADDVLQSAEGKGRIDEQVRRAAGWFKGLGKTEHYTGLDRKDVFLLPEKALREALVNAVVHRDFAITGSKVMLEVFDDRVEVTSPGSLPNTMTPESVRAGGRPRSRNESLANFMTVAGMMEQRGRGWSVMRRAMIEHNSTEPVLDADRSSRFVRVIFQISGTGK